MRLSTRMLLVGCLLLLAGWLPARAQTVLDTPQWKVDAGTVGWLLGSADQTRGAAYNPATGNFLVATRAGGNRVVVLNGATGDSLKSLNMTGITGGALPFSLIAITDDGQIFGSNLANPASEASPLKIYHWVNEEAVPVVAYSGVPSAHRYGDAIGVSGTGNDIIIYSSGSSNPNLALINWNGTAATTDLIDVGAGNARGGIAPVSHTGNIWINQAGGSAKEITRTGTVVRQITDEHASAVSLVDYLEVNGRKLVSIGVGGGNTRNLARIYDVTDPNLTVHIATTASLGSNNNGNGAGAISFDAANKRLFVLVTNNAVASYSIADLLPDPGPELFTEYFEYGAGQLLTAHGWTNHSGTANFIPVTDQTLAYEGYAGSGIGNAVQLLSSGEDIHRGVGTYTQGSVFAAALVNVSAAQADGDYFLHFGREPIGNTFRGRVFVRSNAEGQLAFGVSKAGAAAAADFTGFDYSTNQTILVVVEYRFEEGDGNDVINLYVNPVGSALPATPDATDNVGSDLGDLSNIALRQGNAAIAATLLLGNLRVGSDYGEVVGDPAAPVEPDPTARVQIVHNSAHPAAASVDVWVNGTRAIENFAFRTATPFIDLPADVELTIAITAPGAANANDPVFSTQVTLAEDGTYVVVASGDPTANDGTAFSLFVSEGREAAATPGNVEVLVFHGATDAPAVDVAARGAGVVVPNIAFGEFSASYLSLAPANYTLDILPAGGNEAVASFDAALAGAANAALTVVASGYLAPTGDEAGFGLLAVFADGTTALLPAYQEPGDEPVLLDQEVWRIAAGERAWFANDNATRGGAYNPATDNVVVISRTAGANGRILRAATGAEVGQLNMTGLATAAQTFPINEIAITSDGQIFGTNLSIGDTQMTRVYWWRHERAVPVKVFEGLLPAGLSAAATDTPSYRYGDGIGVYGSGSDISVFIGGSGNDRIVRLQLQENGMLAVAGSVVPQAKVQRGRYGLAPISHDRLFINSPGTQIALVDMQTGIVEEATDDTALMLRASGDIAVFERDDNYWVVSGTTWDFNEATFPEDEHRFVVFERVDEGQYIQRFFTEQLGTSANANASGFAAWDFRRNNIVVMATNNAIASYSLWDAPAEVAFTDPLIVSPADGSTVTLSGRADSRFAATWTAVEGATAYKWSISTDPTFEQITAEVNPMPANATTASVSYSDLDAILAGLNVEVGQSVTIHHRAVVLAPEEIVGPYSSVVVTRGELRPYWTISEARAAGIDTPVTVRGVVNSVDYAQGVAWSNFFIQDEGAGISVFIPAPVAPGEPLTGPQVQPGQYVEVTGTRGNFNMLAQVNATYTDGVPNLTILDPDAGLPEPIEISMEQFRTDSPYESMRVVYRGAYMRPTTAVWPVPAGNSGRNFPIRQVGTEEDRFIRISGRGSELAEPDPLPRPTGYFDVTGTLGRFNTDPQLFVFLKDDVDLRPSRVQLIHSHPAAGSVDVYLEQNRVATLDFGDATPFVDVNYVTAQLQIVPAGGELTAALHTAELAFDIDDRTVNVVTAGEGEAAVQIIAFDGREESTQPANAQFAIVHASPDAPAVDVRPLVGWPFELGDALVQNLAFGDVTQYLSVAPAVYNLALRANNTTVEVFEANLSAAAGAALTVVAEGLLQPGAGQPAFRLSAYTAAGERLTLAVVTSTEPAVELPQVFALYGNYPNPFNPTTNITFDLPSSAEVSIEIYDVSGRRVMSLPAQTLSAGASRTLAVDGASLASGIYLYRLTARMATETITKSGRMTLIK
jgi:hypothetical protein